jgi:hypothetical protein
MEDSLISLVDACEDTAGALKMAKLAHTQNITRLTRAARRDPAAAVAAGADKFLAKKRAPKAAKPVAVAPVADAPKNVKAVK